MALNLDHFEKTPRIFVDEHNTQHYYLWNLKHAQPTNIEDLETDHCRHREDGPAVIYEDGSFWYMQYNKFHRVNGPAVRLLGSPSLWFYNGRQASFDFYRFLREYEIDREEECHPNDVITILTFWPDGFR